MLRRARYLLVLTLAACEPQVLDAVSGERAVPGPSGGLGGAANGGDAGSAASSASGDTGGNGGSAPAPSLRGDALIHRYTFDGTGTLVWDEKGGAHGTVVNTELDGSGTLALAGLGSAQYVDLPDGLVSGLGDATFELWLVWRGGNVWQRAFDFGSSFLASNGLYNGARYLFLTPESDAGTLRAAFSTAGPGGEVVLDAAGPVVAEQLAQLAVVVDDENDVFALYRDGVLKASTAFDQSLSALNDVNNWLGRSQYESDAELGALLHDFRIYDAALSAEEIQKSFEAGPTAVLEP